MKLGRFGIWGSGPWRLDERAAEAGEVAAELEALGFGAVWLGGGQQPGFPPRFRTLLDASSRIIVASGIFSVWLASPEEVAAGFAGLEASHPGRFLLGLGVSHPAMVERLGERYQRPYRRMVEYLDGLDRQQPPVPADRRVLAALGPRMLALAASRAAGAHPYFVPVEHTVRAREALGVAPLLAPEQGVVLERDPERARRIARTHVARYLALPNYTNNLRTLGFGDDDLAGEGSDRLVDAVVAWGDPETVARRVGEHHRAGADHVCIQVLSERAEREFPRAEYRELAGALFG